MQIVCSSIILVLFMWMFIYFKAKKVWDWTIFESHTIELVEDSVKTN